MPYLINTIYVCSIICILSKLIKDVYYSKYIFFCSFIININLLICFNDFKKDYEDFVSEKEDIHKLYTSEVEKNISEETIALKKRWNTTLNKVY